MLTTDVSVASTCSHSDQCSSLLFGSRNNPNGVVWGLGEIPETWQLEVAKAKVHAKWPMSASGQRVT